MDKFKEHFIDWDDIKISRLWDFYSKNYPYNQLYFSKIFGKHIIKKTQKYCKKLDDLIILDFGCGPGFFLKSFAELNIKPLKFIGIDFSENSINKFKKIDVPFDKVGIKINSLPLPIGDNSVDICFLIEVIEHLNDNYLDETLKDIHRVLKSQGKLIITAPNNEDLRLGYNFCPECGCIYHRMQHIRVWDIYSLRDIISRYSFKELKIIETTFVSSNLSASNICYIIKNFFKTPSNLYAVFEK